MAFNPTFETRRKQSTRAVSEDYVSSFFSESQTSWVVFNPEEQLTNDILSLSTHHSPTESEASNVNEAFDSKEVDEKAEGMRNDKAAAGGASGCENATLSSRIDQWQQAPDTSVVSDNVASWDLDAELVGHMFDTSVVSRVPAFYGDVCFRNLSKQDYLRFKRSSAVLRRSLTRKGYDGDNPRLIARLFGLLQWKGLLQSPGSLIDDYVMNTLSRVPLTDSVREDLSDSASSSMVMCGGSSWNDI